MDPVSAHQSSAERYVIEGLLGRGGMGTVYRAFDTHLRRPVALKVLAPVDGLSIEVALHEARAAAAVQHANVATVFDVFADGGTAYIVMELVLGALLRRYVGDLTVGAAPCIRWLAGIAAGLAHAHESGVIHGDVKPDNMIVDERGEAKIIDFGIARLPRGAGEGGPVTPTSGGGLIGTPGYMAPELSSPGSTTPAVSSGAPRPRPEFRDPDLEAPVDLAAHLAMDRVGGKCKGMIFQAYLAEGSRKAPLPELFAQAGVAERRFLPFGDYPAADAGRMLCSVARLVHPDVPHGEGVRRLARDAFASVAQSTIMEVSLGAFAFDFEQVLIRSMKAYAVLHGFGKFACEKQAPDRFLVHMRGFPSFLETAQIGVLEGLLLLARTRGRVRIHLENLARATFEIQILARIG